MTKKNFTTIIFTLSIIFLPFLSLNAKVNIDSNSLKILEMGKVSEFIGDVRITSEELYITADRAISREDKDIIEVSGNVYVKYSSTTWNLEGWCERLKVLSENNIMIMDENSRTIYRTTDLDNNEEVEIFADHVKMDYSENQHAFFEGNVKADNSKLNVLSDNAFYSKKKEMIEFTGNPRAVSNIEDFKSEYSGDKILMRINTEEVNLSGNAHTKVEFKNGLKM
jgi:lipopolysaccharide export system protein LptA